MAKVKLINYNGLVQDVANGTDFDTAFGEYVEKKSINLSFINLDNHNDSRDVVSMFDIAYDYSTDDGVLVVFDSKFGIMEMSALLSSIKQDGDWTLHSEMIWVHTNSPLSFPNATSYFHNYTKMYVFTHGDRQPGVFNPLCETCKNAMALVDLERSTVGDTVRCVDARTVNSSRIRTGVWACCRDYSQVDPSDVIIEDHVRSWTNAGMNVLDLTPKEGYVADVCQKMDRNVFCLCDDEASVTSIESRLFGDKKVVDERQMLFDF